jgi:hypothetical protein
MASSLLLASIFAGQFAVPMEIAPPLSGAFYDPAKQLSVDAQSGIPVVLLTSDQQSSDTTITTSNFCRPTNADGSDDTTYSAPDGFDT